MHVLVVRLVLVPGLDGHQQLLEGLNCPTGVLRGVPVLLLWWDRCFHLSALGLELGQLEALEAVSRWLRRQDSVHGHLAAHRGHLATGSQVPGAADPVIGEFIVWA